MQERSSVISKNSPLRQAQGKLTEGNNSGELGLAVEGIYWIEKVVVVEKQVRFF
jgi:hypothetical protein